MVLVDLRNYRWVVVLSTFRVALAIGTQPVTLRTTMPHADAVKIDPKLPPCYEDAPYSFRYVGQATIPANLKGIKSTTGTFTNLKCSEL